MYRVAKCWACFDQRRLGRVCFTRLQAGIEWRTGYLSGVRSELPTVVLLQPRYTVLCVDCVNLFPAGASFGKMIYQSGLFVHASQPNKTEKVGRSDAMMDTTRTRRFSDTFDSFTMLIVDWTGSTLNPDASMSEIQAQCCQVIPVRSYAAGQNGSGRL
jgi:hypothetical protein